jgi:hypothetical protein
MASSGILRRVALVRIDVSEELSASFIRATRIDELRTTLAVSNRRTHIVRYSNASVASRPELRLTAVSVVASRRVRRAEL